MHARPHTLTDDPQTESLSRLIANAGNKSENAELYARVDSCQTARHSIVTDVTAARLVSADG